MAKKESLTNKTFIGFFWTAGGSLLNAVVQIGVLAALARLISPESFGLVQAALIVVGFAQLISKMGIGPALVQRQELTEKHIRVGFTFSLSLGIVLGGLIFLNARLIASFFEIKGLTSVLKVISLLFIAESFVTVSSSLIQREMRLKERAVVEICSYIFGYGLLGIIFGYLGFDYWALIIAIFGQQFIKVIAYTILQKHSLKPYWRKKEFQDLIYFGGGFTLGRLFGYFASQGDNIIIGKYLGAGALGFYSRAYTLIKKPTSLIGGALDKALFPAFAAKQTEKTKILKAYVQGTKLIFLVSILTTGVIYFSANEIILVLLGENWTEVIIPAQILITALIFKMGYRISDNVVTAMGHVMNRAKMQFVYMLAILIGSFIGSKYGINGVALGTVLATLLYYTLITHLALKVLDSTWFYLLKKTIQEILIGLGLSLIYGLIVLNVRNVFDSNILNLIISSSAYILIIGIIFYFYREKLDVIQMLPFKNKFKRYYKK